MPIVSDAVSFMLVSQATPFEERGRVQYSACVHVSVHGDVSICMYVSLFL